VHKKSRIFEAMQKAKALAPTPVMPAPDLDFSTSSVEPVFLAGPAGPVQNAEPTGTRIQFVEVVQQAAGRLEPRLGQMLTGEGLWAEQFRTLREKLRTLEGSANMRCLGIVSATAGEGKSTIAIALSLVLAQQPGKRVLLVDADLRKPDVGRYLGLAETRGLAEWLTQPSETVRIQRLASHGLYVLHAGRPPKRPWELIARPQLGELLATARREFDFVVVDCAPQTPVADTARIQDWLDGVILVVRARMAPREAILNTVDQLKEEKILGIVFNDYHSVISSYYYQGYQYYRSHQERV